jgi:hypothetical protein
MQLIQIKGKENKQASNKGKLQDQERKQAYREKTKNDYN